MLKDFAALAVCFLIVVFLFLATLAEHEARTNHSSANTLVCPEGTTLVNVSNVAISYPIPRGRVAEEIPLYGCYPARYNASANTQ
jgi:hypothetical protein